MTWTPLLGTSGGMKNLLPQSSMQRGYALVLMLVSLLVMSGVGAISYVETMREEAEQARVMHNQRVLKEAKQALLNFAYRYPQFSAQGPGRLPCPDTDDSGTPNANFGCSSKIGRFPWDQTNLDFYDVRDADNERLWYAVSRSFSTHDNGEGVNSDSTGLISMHDQTGKLMIDASDDLSNSPHRGIAAVIIAPGAPIERDGVLQDRGVGADLNDPVNYLD